MATDLVSDTARRVVEYPIPLAAGVGGVLTSVAGSVAQTAESASGAAQQVGGANLAWAGTAIAVAGLGVQVYLMATAARRKSRAEDAAADLLHDTREEATWGGKYREEVRLRSEAEGRIILLEKQNAEQARVMLGMQAKLEGLQSKLDEFKNSARKAVKQLDRKVDENAARVAAVEVAQGSTSGIEIPATPVPPEPKS